MKTLQQAAREYMQNVLENSDLNVNYEENNYDAGVMHTLTEALEPAFLAGAAFTFCWISVEDELPERNQLVFLKALSYRENPERTIIGVGLLDKAGFWCDEFGRRYDLMQIKILAWRLIEYKK